MDTNKEKESEWKKLEAKQFDEEWSAILEKDVPLLTTYDKQFLVARRHMLSSDQLKMYGDVIEKTLAANLKGKAKKASSEPTEDEPTDE